MSSTGLPSLLGNKGAILGGYGRSLGLTMFNQQYTIVTDGFTCERAGTAFVDYDIKLHFFSNVVAPGSVSDYAQLDSLIGDTKQELKVHVTGEVICHSKPLPEPELKCGDYRVSGQEQCDMTELNQQTCETLGFAGGKLGCDAECQFDTRYCYISQKFSCAENARESQNSFEYSYDRCENDCQDGYYCDTATCTCHIIPTPSTGGTALSGISLEPAVTTPTVPGYGMEDFRWEPAPEPSVGTAAAAQETGSQAPTAATAETKQVAAIKYGDQYISVEQVVKCDGSECNGAEHWHVLAPAITDIYGNPVPLPAA
ncbi:MAG: hypothetical protein H6765_00760 [Candidatus Peribacteria bacterium]|nr:MAG: hypothetical protein H6765_00760 [Candidatus Peribacteria bacterium]